MSDSTQYQPLTEIAEWKSYVIKRLKKDLKDKRLVIVVGAGVSLSATADEHGKPLPRLTWPGLIRNGLGYLVTGGYVEASNRRVIYAYEQLSELGYSAPGLLDAAGILTSLMTESRQLPTWLDSVFGNLEVKHPAILNVLNDLHQSGATILTTNYDDLLEKACHIPRIGRSNQDDILKFKRGDLDGVFHVHGSYQDPLEVVLDRTDYYKVTQADEVQNILHTFLEYRTVLFVGCGSGLEDPNFGALLKWVSQKHANLPNRHCLLVRDGDESNFNMLIPLKYGAEYDHLIPFLIQLLDDSPQMSAKYGSVLPDHGFGTSSPFVSSPKIPIPGIPQTKSAVPNTPIQPLLAQIVAQKAGNTFYRLPPDQFPFETRFDNELSQALNKWLSTPAASLLYLEHNIVGHNDKTDLAIGAQIVRTCKESKFPALIQAHGKQRSPSDPDIQDSISGIIYLMLAIASDIVQLLPPDSEQTASIRIPLRRHPPSEPITLNDASTILSAALASAPPNLHIVVTGNPAYWFSHSEGVNSFFTTIRNAVQATQSGLKLILLTHRKLHEVVKCLQPSEITLVRSSSGVKAQKLPIVMRRADKV